jgi:hypothetical protein
MDGDSLSNTLLSTLPIKDMHTQITQNKIGVNSVHNIHLLQCNIADDICIR